MALVCRKGLSDFFLKTGIVDQVFEVEKGNAKSYSEILRQLKLEEIDHVFSPHESLRSVLFCTKLKAKKRISFKKPWNFVVFDTRVTKDMRLPDPLRQLSLLSPWDSSLKEELQLYPERQRPYSRGEQGRLPAPPEWASMSLRAEVLGCAEIFESLQKRFDLQGVETGKAVLIFPGSVWATKRWTVSGFIASGLALKKQGYIIYVMGGPGEEELAQQVADGIPGAVSLAGKTKVIESAQLIARAALVLGNDSASAHLAAVCETPLIALFGPTVLKFGYRPWSAQSYVVERDSLRCRPCGKHGHAQCPIGTHECMKAIPPEDVVRTAEFILRS